MTTTAPVPATMRAVRLVAWGAPPVLTEVPVPAPGPLEVLLAVDAAGLCHSDLHVMDAPAGALPFEPPFTLGHEVAGHVVSVGALVDPEWVDRSVAVHGIWACGDCRNCARGRENYCLRLTGPIGCGLGHDGGLAEYLLVDDVRRLVPVAGLAPALAAPLTDAGLTAQHVVRLHRELLTGGGVAVVVGVGGLGHLAIQILAATVDCTVVAVDPLPSARELAARCGATTVLASLAEVATAGNAADVVFDFVGSAGTLAAAPGLLAPGGALAVVGSGGGTLAVGKGGALPSGWSVHAPFWGPRTDLVDVLALGRRGAVTSATERVGLDGALAAYGRLRGGRVTGRVVVVPDQEPPGDVARSELLGEVY